MLLFCFLLPAAQAQSIEQFVKQNTVAISSIQPDTSDDSDLEVIGKAIGNARLVLLGEQDHGDAPTFLAKTRLIKYLHQKQGFTVLAFESDFFGLNEGWAHLAKTDQQMDSFLNKNIFPIWTYCDACSNLFYKYIPSTYHTDQPFQMSGFDNQMILEYTRQHLSRQLDSMLRLLQLPVTKQPAYATLILPLIDSLPTWSFASSKHNDSLALLKEQLQNIREELRKKVSDDNFWLHIVDNLIVETAEFQEFAKPKEKRHYSMRDSQMAMNIKWLADVKYPNEKIIIWAANSHIAKYKATVTKRNEESTETMGSFLARDSLIKRNTYTLGFTSYHGSAGRLSFLNYSVPKAKSNSYSDWIYSGLHYPYAFTDFTLFNQMQVQNTSFSMRGFGHRETKLQWTNIFDGVFYIQDMYPCKNIYRSLSK